MATSKKFSINLVEENSTWTAQIIRRVTARNSIVSKAQDGFATQAQAQTWADEEFKIFVKVSQERNKRR